MRAVDIAWCARDKVVRGRLGPRAASCGWPAGHKGDPLERSRVTELSTGCGAGDVGCRRALVALTHCE